MKTAVHFCLTLLYFIPAVLFARSPKELEHADFTANVTSGCTSLTVVFSDESVAPDNDPIIGYTWYFGDGNTSSIQHPSHTYTNSGMYNVKLVVVSQSGWKDSIMRANYISVLAAPIAQLGPDTTFCFGNLLTLDAGNPGATYLWNTGDMSQQIDIFWAGEYTVEITKGGCTAYDTIIAYTNQPLFANFAFQHEPGCLPTKVSFIDLSQTCEGNIVSWSWNFGDGNTSTEQNPEHIYNADGYYTVQLIITDNFGGVTALEQEVVISSTVPVISLGADTSICSGTTLMLTSGIPDASYQWSTGETTPDINVSSPGIYWLMVSNNGTCSAIDTIEITLSKPTTPHFDYQVQPGCAPVDVQFTDRSTTCGGSVISQWFWEFGDGTTSSLQNPLHGYIAAGQYNVKLTVTTTSGFTETINLSVTVLSTAPVVNLGKDTAICENAILQLNAGISAANYFWSTGEITQSINIDMPGKYWIRVAKNNCFSSDTINITMNPALSPAFGYSYQTQCLPVTVNFIDSTKACGTTVNSWRWDFGDGTLSSQQHPSHNYLMTGTYTVRLTVTSIDGSVATKSRNVVITTGLFKTNLGSDTTICYGNSIILDAGNAGSTYIWNTGDATRTIEVTDPGNYWVRVEKSGCVAFDTITIRNTFPVTPNFGYEISSKCLPVQVQFRDSSLVLCGGSITNWRWEFGDGTTSIEKDPTHIYTKSDTFNVRLTITAANGVMISKMKRIFIENSIPVLNLGAPLSICKGSLVQLEAGIPNAVYTWSPKVAINNDTIRNPIINPELTTTYSVTVTKCMVTVTDDITIQVDSLRRPAINQEGNTLKSTPAEFYQWYKDEQLIEGATSRTYRAKYMGHYTVKIRSGRGCENESLPHLFVPRKYNGAELNGISISISPNPTTGLLKILFDVKPEKPISVTIIDRYGKRMTQIKIDQQINQVRLHALAKGQYFLEFKMGEKVVVVPVVVQ